MEKYLPYPFVAAGIACILFTVRGVLTSRAPTGQRVLAQPIHLAAFYVGIGLCVMPVLSLWIVTHSPTSLIPALMIGAGLGVLLGALRQRRRDAMIAAYAAKES